MIRHIEFYHAIRDDYGECGFGRGALYVVMLRCDCYSTDGVPPKVSVEEVWFQKIIRGSGEVAYSLHREGRQPEHLNAKLWDALFSFVNRRMNEEWATLEEKVLEAKTLSVSYGKEDYSDVI